MGKSLPWDDASFDAALNLGVLDHTLRPKRVLAEIHRVVKPGGILWFANSFTTGSRLRVLWQNSRIDWDWTRTIASRGRRETSSGSSPRPASRSPGPTIAAATPAITFRPYGKVERQPMIGGKWIERMKNHDDDAP